MVENGQEGEVAGEERGRVGFVVFEADYEPEGGVFEVGGVCF